MASRGLRKRSASPTLRAMSSSDLAFDPSIYVRAPLFAVPEGLILGRTLIAACPRSLHPAVKLPSARLEKRLAEAEAALLNRQRQGSQSEEDTRALDAEMDACFWGIKLRLDGYAALPARLEPKSQRASQLQQRLFGEGMNFLRDSYAGQLATMQTLLQRIEDDKLTRELDDLCGPEFLDHIKRLLPRYQKMVQAVLTRETTVSENLSHHRIALQRAISAYASAVCGTVDDTDEASIRLAQTALAPLDNLRASLASRRSPESPAPAPAPIEPASP